MRSNHKLKNILVFIGLAFVNLIQSGCKNLLKYLKNLVTVLENFILHDCENCIITRYDVIT